MLILKMLTPKGEQLLVPKMILKTLTSKGEQLLVSILKTLIQKGEPRLTHNHYLPLALTLMSRLTKLIRLMNMRWTNNHIWIMTQRHKSKSRSKRFQEIGELQKCPTSKKN